MGGVFISMCNNLYDYCRASITKNPKNLNSNFFLALPYSNNIGFLLTGGVCISMYNSKGSGCLIKNL